MLIESNMSLPVQRTLSELEGRRLRFRGAYERSADTGERFSPIDEWAQRSAVKCNRPLRLARFAWDRVEIVRKFRQAGLLTPASVVLPSIYSEPPSHFDWTTK